MSLNIIADINNIVDKLSRIHYVVKIYKYYPNDLPYKFIWIIIYNYIVIFIDNNNELIGHEKLNRHCIELYDNYVYHIYDDYSFPMLIDIYVKTNNATDITTSVYNQYNYKLKIIGINSFGILMLATNTMGINGIKFMKHKGELIDGKFNQECKYVSTKILNDDWIDIVYGVKLTNSDMFYLISLHNIYLLDEDLNINLVKENVISVHKMSGRILVDSFNNIVVYDTHDKMITIIKNLGDKNEIIKTHKLTRQLHSEITINDNECIFMDSKNRINSFNLTKILDKMK